MLHTHKKGITMSVRTSLFLAILLAATTAWGESSNVTQSDPFRLHTTAYPYNFHSTDERRIAKDMRPLHKNGEWLSYSITAVRSTADFSTDAFQQKHRPLFNLPGPWHFNGLFYQHTPVFQGGANNNINITPFQAFLADELNIDLRDPDTRQAFAEVIDPMNADTRREFGYVDVPGEYRKHGIRFELDAHISCDFGLRVRSGVSDIRSTPCIESVVPNPANPNEQSTAAILRGERRCDLFRRSCQGTGLTCPTSRNQDVRIDDFTGPQKQVVLNKFIKQFDTLASLLGYDPTAYNETDVEDLEFQLYWRHPFHINEERARWPYFIITPFLLTHVTAPVSEEISPTELFAIPNGNNGFGAYGFSGGFSIDFIDMVQIAFDASMTQFSKENRSNFPVLTTPLQQGILPRTADVTIEPGTNWSFGAALYAYYIFDYLSFHIEYRIVSHTEDDIEINRINTLSQSRIEQAKEIANNLGTVQLVDSTGEPFGNREITDMVNFEDIDKHTLIERSKWESHVVNIGLHYDISPHISLGFLWQAPATQRNAFKQTSLLWSIVVTF